MQHSNWCCRIKEVHPPIKLLLKVRKCWFESSQRRRNMMQTELANRYFEMVGEPVHSINTICVGLSYVWAGVSEKPPEMTISWKPTDKRLAAERARHFALRAGMALVVEAAKTYVRALGSSPFAGDLFRKFGSDESAEAKLKVILNTFGCQNICPYHA